MIGFMNYFENNELDFNDTQLLQKMQNVITRIFQLEIEELGYSYKPNRDNSENTFELSFITILKRPLEVSIIAEQDLTTENLFKENLQLNTILQHYMKVYKVLIKIKECLLAKHYSKLYFMKYSTIDNI